MLNEWIEMFWVKLKVHQRTNKGNGFSTWRQFTIENHRKQIIPSLRTRIPVPFLHDSIQPTLMRHFSGCGCRRGSPSICLCFCHTPWRSQRGRNTVTFPAFFWGRPSFLGMLRIAGRQESYRQQSRVPAMTGFWNHNTTLNITWMKRNIVKLNFVPFLMKQSISGLRQEIKSCDPTS